MKGELTKWFHQPEWIMKLDPNEPLEASRVNGHLFTCEDLVHNAGKEMSNWAIAEAFIRNLKNMPDSHDNITGVLTLSRIFNFRQTGKKKLRKMFFARIRHPRDYIYWFNLPSAFIFPIHLWTMLTKYKYRDITGDGNKEQILKTDGLKLMMLRNSWYEKSGDLFYKLIVRHITDYILKKRFGDNYKQAIMRIFFKHPDHPLRFI